MRCVYTTRSSGLSDEDVSSDFPPYTTMQGGNPAGIGVDAVLPILDDMGVKYVIRLDLTTEGR